MKPPCTATSKAIRTTRWLRLAAARCAILIALAAVSATGCAKSSEVERLDESTRVQEERIRALEDSLPAQLGKIAGATGGNEERIAALQRQMDAVQGRQSLLIKTAEQLAAEQALMTERQERIQAGESKLARRFEEEAARMLRTQTESESELDKMRVDLAELRKVLSSPIAELPARNPADRELRAAYFLLINGEFDLAADAFARFAEARPKDQRTIEARYRQGQAYFLLRRYDHAMIPFFEVVDKAAQHALATPARWMLARSLEETGDLKLAREFYAQLINEKTPYATDATRRVAFINKLYGDGKPR